MSPFQRINWEGNGAAKLSMPLASCNEIAIGFSLAFVLTLKTYGGMGEHIVA